MDTTGGSLAVSGGGSGAVGVSTIVVPDRVVVSVVIAGSSVSVDVVTPPALVSLVVPAVSPVVVGVVVLVVSGVVVVVVVSTTDGVLPDPPLVPDVPEAEAACEAPADAHSPDVVLVTPLEMERQYGAPESSS